MPPGRCPGATRALCLAAVSSTHPPLTAITVTATAAPIPQFFSYSMCGAVACTKNCSTIISAAGGLYNYGATYMRCGRASR